jgi:predicted DNA-binding transcriptional regulator YafY
LNSSRAASSGEFKFKFAYKNKAFKSTMKEQSTLCTNVPYIEVAGLDEIKQWVMSLGPEAYVEEPKELRDMVKADMKKALVQYEGIRPAFQEPELLESRVDFSR